MCHKEFKSKPSKRSLYCSLKCVGIKNSLSANPDLIIKSKCLLCLDEFEYYKHNGLGKYCSRICKTTASRISDEEKYKRMIRSYEKNVIKSDGCWDWNGFVMSNGYGSISQGTNKQIGAHRASYIIHKGKISRNIMVLHKCDNRICTNPDHLFLGNQRDNMQDALKKGRMRGHFPKGIIPHNKKLTREHIDFIEANKGRISIKKMAHILNTTIHVVQGYSRKLNRLAINNPSKT